jgi:GT2 family glycosyltransferase
MSMANYKVLVGMPVYDSVHVETVSSLLALYRDCQTPVIIRFVPYTYIHLARNMLLMEAIDLDATHLLFIDADMVFPKDGLDKLIAHDKDIIGGLYHTRAEKHNPVIYRKKGDSLEIIEDYPKDKIFKVDVIGTGFLLIKMEVFKNMQPPFFYYADPEEYGLKSVHLADLGEDTTFCLKARKNNYKIFCDPTIKIGHIGKEIYY